MPRTRPFSERDANIFWSRRYPETVIKKVDLQATREKFVNEKLAYDNRIAQEKEDFLNSTNFNNPTRNKSMEETVDSLRFWIKFLSWTYCDNCHLLQRQILPHNFSDRPRPKPQPCNCKSKRYVIPDCDEIPLGLLNLSMKDILVLRPFDIDCGVYRRMQHGYRVKDGAFQLNPSQKSVSQKIQDLTHVAQKQRCSVAYDLLIHCSRSSYKYFIDLRQELLSRTRKLSIFEIFQFEGIECALWPALYPFKSWCESSLDGRESRESGKVAFFCKAFSNVLDYSSLFEIVHFQYDRWLFKTITGAIQSARVQNCSPHRALDMKAFSPGYWQWQHRFLLDAVSQYGLPSLFLTISPYEWSFPFPVWIEDMRGKTGLGPTKIAGPETIHIANVLEQMVRGYLCGSNSARWSKHVFNNTRSPKEKNVLTYFYRFEFQNRGTVHLHLLVWLKNINNIQFQRIRADIPKSNKELGFLAHKLQKSKDKSPCLAIQSEPTHVSSENNQLVLKVVHPADAFERNLRAYIDTILPTLQCHMDVQTTNGKSMVLRYVSSYVSKWKDSIDLDSLYSRHVTPYQAAFRYLRCLKPCEPEMWFALSSIKPAWSCSRTKRYAVPSSDKAAQDKIATKYRQRPQSMENKSFVQWLREVDHNPTQPKPYKFGTTLVGLKFLSLYNNQFFFQKTLMNVPHRTLEQLYHPDASRMPDNLKFFVSATTLLPQIWNDKAVIKETLEMEGHKNYFIETFISYVQSLKDLHKLWRLQVFTNQQLVTNNSAISRQMSLQGLQLQILSYLKAALCQRDLFYSRPSVQRDESDSESDTEIDPGYNDQHDIPSPDEETYSSANVDWTRYVLITGKPGCGKTHTLNACISHCIVKHQKVFVIAPTGFLACKFKASFGEDITTDTVHSAFYYPVEEHAIPSVNWHLSTFDFLVIDEISMIPERIFNHILSTIVQLPSRPIVFFSGDEAQQQPIHSVNGKTVQVHNIMTNKNFLKSVVHYKLVQQFRCTDPKLQSFLDHVRNWTPTQPLLDSIQDNLIYDGLPSDELILETVSSHPTGTVLTVTKRACNRINSLVVQRSFEGQQALLIGNCDCDLPPIPLYKGMKVLITQNRDKNRGFVNGQQATIVNAENKTVFLRLENGQILHTHLVTYIALDGTRKTVYPFSPAYATTICKAQGQTLPKAIIWFDSQHLPAGAAYVAISRVKTLDSLFFLSRMKVAHFKPAISIK